MKKSTIIFFLVLAILKTQAQDYLISFAGAGATTVVGTVKVDNLTSGTTLTLNGGAVLHLIASVGMDALNMDNDNVQLYPNPMSVQSTLTFIAPENGNTVIGIVDLSGRIVCQISTLVSTGTHSFRISGLSKGMYFVKVTGKNYFYSTKLINQSNLQREARVEFVSSVKTHTSNLLKSAAATIDMAYTDGDQLLFKGISGIYSTVVADVPVSSKTITFNFAACTDADNNNYSIVQIGAQTWMAENLKVGVRIDGIQAQTNNNIIEKYCYNNDEANCTIYGGLYQWNEMMQYVTTPGVRGLCPAGWHLPSDVEWTTLTTFIGGGGAAAGKMKSTGTVEAGTGLWYAPNTGATNATGFTADPGGDYYWGDFRDIGTNAVWWTSSEYYNYNADSAWYRVLYSNFNYIGPYYYAKSSGFSVRCLLDNTIPFTCGTSITMNHVSGAVAPVNKTVTYGTVTNIPGEPSKCWITSNLGADHQATAVNDATEASAGWYWQFNCKQGYKHDGTTRTPNTSWISSINETTDWITANDPCNIELGTTWRIPTYTEWYNVDNTGDWYTWTGPWGSGLKLHAAGYLYNGNGSLDTRGSFGYYWSNAQYDDTYGRYFYFNIDYSGMYYYNKAIGFSVRCLRD